MWEIFKANNLDLCVKKINVRRYLWQLSDTMAKMGAVLEARIDVPEEMRGAVFTKTKVSIFAAEKSKRTRRRLVS